MEQYYVIFDCIHKKYLKELDINDDITFKFTDKIELAHNFENEYQCIEFLNKRDIVYSQYFEIKKIYHTK